MYDATAVYFDPILTNFSVGYQPQDLVGTFLSPIVPTAYQSGKYRVFDRSNWLVPGSDRREPGTVAHEIYGRKYSSDTYFAVEHALQAPVTDEERQNLGIDGTNPANAALFAGIDPMMDATQLVTNQILLGLENQIQSVARNTANYASGLFTTLSGTAQWSDHGATSDPITDIEVGMRAVFSKIYRMPNLMILPWGVMSQLKNHPKIVSRIQYFQTSTEGVLNQLTGFQGRVVVPQSVYNTADNYDATESVSEFWGKDVILACVDDAPKLNTKCFMKTFAQPYPDGSIRNVTTWREEPRKSDIVRCAMKYDTKVVSNTAAYIIKAAIA